jgi:hypothetical protein
MKKTSFSPLKTLKLNLLAILKPAIVISWEIKKQPQWAAFYYLLQDQGLKRKINASTGGKSPGLC